MLFDSHHTAALSAKSYNDFDKNKDELLKYTQLYKLANFGSMLAGTLHTFNNILGGILGYSQLMKSELPEESNTYRQAGVIEGAAKRASKLISQLQYLSRRESYRKVPVDAAVIITEVLAILESSFRKNISVVSEFNHNKARINVDLSSMCHALLNLAFNASDAMPNGGQLLFATDVCDASKGENLLASPKHLRICVRDTGSGIGNDILPCVFEPFYTTNDGTGMGLTIAKGIVEDHGGTIDVRTEEREGTEFTISLPLATQSADYSILDVETTINKNSPGRGELILVVDDEADLRQMTKQILTNKGYRVLVADSGQSAIEIFEKHIDQIDLVILDMIMPGVDGTEVYNRIKYLASNLRVILTSGYLNNPPFQALLDKGEDTFIQKPWDIGELLEQTQKVLT